jgi:Glycosyl transferase family 2
MKICVVTPYFQTPLEWVIQAHESVKAQTIPASHIVICDGSEPAQIPAFQGTHILLGRNYKDYGNTPRLIGCYNAITHGAEAIAFLDADNWFEPDHLQALRDYTVANNLDACSSARMLHRLDGSVLAKCALVNARPYVDTNCLFVMKSAFPHMIAWTLQNQDNAAVMDQEVWRHMHRMGARLGFLDRPSVCYRTRHASHYRQVGEAPPPDAIDRRDPHGERYQ